MSILRNAIRANNIEGVQQLIDGGANVNEKGIADNTHLHYAALMGKTQMVKILLQAGAEVNSKNFCGSTPLAVAKSKSYPHIHALLKQHRAKI